MNTTGLSSRMALLRRPLASAGVAGMTTLSPGTWAYQLSNDWECWAPSWRVFDTAVEFRPVKIQIVSTSAELYGRINDPHSFLWVAPNQSMKVHASPRVQLQPGT